MTQRDEAMRPGGRIDGGGMAEGGVSPAARRYALAILFCAYVMNYIDRQVVTILQEPIKAELHLSDTQLGLVTGLSFALFYAVLGVPIARAADHRSRTRIIAVSMALWSAMTALCAAATGFVSLLLYRIGVGVGEAGLTPPAHSLISDYYEPERRSGALAIYQAAGTVGLAGGLLMGGWINQFFGWRAALLAVGAPGILLALLVWLTVREPKRGAFDAETAPLSAAAADGARRGAIAALLRDPVFRCLALGAGFHTFVTYGQGNWTAPFLGRVHGLSSGEIGTWLALLSIGPALIGMLGGGWLADRLARRRRHGRIELAAASIALMIPFEIGSFGAADATVSLVVFSGTFFLAGVYLPATIAEVHAQVPPGVRASASALLMLSINLIGLGIGPLVAGMLSDHWAAIGPEGLRYALLALIPAELLAILLFLRARTLASRRA